MWVGGALPGHREELAVKGEPGLGGLEEDTARDWPHRLGGGRRGGGRPGFWG